MRRYITYKRVSGGENQKSGLGLDAQERDIQLFLENYADDPYEVLGEFVEIQTGTDNDRPELTAAIALAKKENAVLMRKNAQTLKAFREVRVNAEKQFSWLFSRSSAAAGNLN